MQPDPDVLARRIDDNLVLVHLRTDRIYEMNATAARVWELIGAGCDAGQIRTALLRDFDVRATALEAELKDVLASLETEGLVVPNGGGQH